MSKCSRSGCAEEILLSLVAAGVLWPRMGTVRNLVGTRADFSGRSGRKAASRPLPLSVGITPRERMLHGRYRDLVRHHLSRIFGRLFADFTGLHFHIAWSEASPAGWEIDGLPTGCSVCCRLSGSPLRPECRTCGPRRLRRTLQSRRGHCFTCKLGVRNCWVPIHVRGETLGIAYLQALQHPPPRPPGRPAQAPGRPAAPGHSGAPVVSKPKFARAARFLSMIVQQVQTASLSDLRKADLTSAGRAVAALEREQARLRMALHRHLPAAPEVHRASPESHAEEIIQSLLERVEVDYPHPLTLRQVARGLGMNAAYLSTLFSRTVGVPFKTYLTGLRVTKAKELLGNSARSVSEVAFAVGYASEERFRSAFKKVTALPPRVWRETMQIPLPRRSSAPATAGT